MLGTLLGWWVYDITRDAFSIGMIGLSEVVPAVSLALYAGHIIDVSEKRKLILVAVGVYVAAVLCLAFLSGVLEGGMIGKNGTVIVIYAIVFATGIVRSFASPVFHTVLAGTVPKHILQNATSLNQSAWLTASVLGHAAAGLCIAVMGNTSTLLLIGAVCGASFLILTNLEKQPPLAAVSHRDDPIKSMKEGLSYVFRTKEILSALTLDLIAVLFGGAVAMVPLFARDLLHTGPIGFGWLNAAADIGSMTTILALTFRPFKGGQGKKLIYAIGGFGCCILLFAFSTHYWLSFLALLFSGMFDGASVVIRGAVMQLKTPDHLRGRVMSVNSMFINSSNELGQFESGLASRLLGPVVSVVFGGCVTLVVVAVTWFRSPVLKKMEY